MGSSRPENGKVHIYQVQEFGGEYRQSSTKSPEGLIYFKHISGGGGLIETGGLIESAALLNLAKTMVSVIHKKTRIQSGKAQVQEVGGPAAEDQKQYKLPVGE